MSMSYSKLNQIYADSILIQVGEHKAHIGDVGRPWDKLNEKNQDGSIKLPKKIADSTLFANFQSDFGTSAYYKESSWKCHLSIHPYDVGKAWDIIYPILLASNVPCFKTTRMAPAEIMLNEMKKVDAAFLAQNYLSIQDKNQAIQDILRVFHGMQITIYIEEGKEKEYNKLLEKIEPLLYQAGVRPGIIDKSDRAIGIYSSVRHVGVGYTSHEKVNSYKRTEIKDPFKSIKPVWKDIQIPWYGLNYTKHISKAKNLLQQLLDGKNKYDHGIITKRDLLQVSDVAIEYFTRWQHLLYKTPDKTILSSKDWKNFHNLKKWIDDGCQLINLIRENKTKKIKEAEDGLSSALNIDETNDDPLRKLKRQNAQRHLIEPKIKTTKPDDPVEQQSSTQDILTQLHKERKQQFRALKAKSESNLKLPKPLGVKISQEHHSKIPASVPHVPSPNAGEKGEQVKNVHDQKNTLIEQPKVSQLKEPGFFDLYSGRFWGTLGGASTGALLGFIAAIFLTQFTLGLSLIVIPIFTALVGAAGGYFAGNQIIDLPAEHARQEKESIPTMSEPVNKPTLTKKKRPTAATLPVYSAWKKEHESGVRIHDGKRYGFLVPKKDEQKSGDEIYTPIQQKI